MLPAFRSTFEDDLTLVPRCEHTRPHTSMHSVNVRSCHIYDVVSRADCHRNQSLLGSHQVTRIIVTGSRVRVDGEESVVHRMDNFLGY